MGVAESSSNAVVVPRVQARRGSTGSVAVSHGRRCGARRDHGGHACAGAVGDASVCW